MFKNNQRNGLDSALDSVKDNNNSMFKSMEGASEQSHVMEIKLREENMLLRQEILQLKKALFMNNLNDAQSSVENINSLLSP